MSMSPPVLAEACAALRVPLYDLERFVERLQVELDALELMRFTGPHAADGAAAFAAKLRPATERAAECCRLLENAATVFFPARPLEGGRPGPATLDDVAAALAELGADATALARVLGRVRRLPEGRQAAVLRGSEIDRLQSVAERARRFLCQQRPLIETMLQVC